MQNVYTPVASTPHLRQTHERETRTTSRRAKLKRCNSCKQEIPAGLRQGEPSTDDDSLENASRLMMRILSTPIRPFEYLRDVVVVGCSSIRETLTNHQLPRIGHPMLIAIIAFAVLLCPYKPLNPDEDPLTNTVLERYQAVHGRPCRPPQNTAEMLDFIHRNHRGFAEFREPGFALGNTTTTFWNDAVWLGKISQDLARLDLPASSSATTDVHVAYTKLHVDIAQVMTDAYLNTTSAVLLASSSLQTFVNDLRLDYEHISSMSVDPASSKQVLKHSVNLLQDNIMLQRKLRWLSTGLKGLLCRLKDTDKLYHDLDTTRRPVLEVLKKDLVSVWRPALLFHGRAAKRARLVTDLLSQIEEPNHVSIREEITRLLDAVRATEDDMETLWNMMVQYRPPFVTNATLPYLERVKTRAEELQAIGKDLRRARDKARWYRQKGREHEVSVDRDGKGNDDNKESLWFKVGQWGKERGVK